LTKGVFFAIILIELIIKKINIKLNQGGKDEKNVNSVNDDFVTP